MVESDLTATTAEASLAVRVFREQALAVRAAALGITVTDAASLSLAAESLTTCRQALKDFEARRVQLVKPLNDQVTETNRLFKGVTGPVQEADVHLSMEITAYQREQKRLADLEMERLRQEKLRLESEAAEKLKDAEVAKASLDSAETLDALFEASEKAVTASQEASAAIAEATAPVLMPAVPARALETARGTLQLKTTWDYEILSGDMVPREYWILNHAAIGKAVRSGVRAIPGVRIFERDDTALRPITRREG